MNLFDVYSLYNIEPKKAKGAYVYDAEGKEFLDFYGGHAVISIGHSHPHYIEKISSQLHKIGFYSNAVVNGLQQELADKLGKASKLKDFAIFYCSTGAEANENALKLASFANGKTKILALEKGFHGRTSASVRATDNMKIQAPINQTVETEYLPINDIDAFEQELKKGDVCAVIIEAIQGIGGCYTCDDDFLIGLSGLCKKYNAYLIMDEVQCGYARSGDFFAFQKSGITPDIISMAKGMGNGFPIAGILINEKVFKPEIGMLGTTFGGSHLACAAGIAVLDVIEAENLVENAKTLGIYFKHKLEEFIKEDIEILGRGLMIGIKFPYSTANIRKELLFNHHIFSGSSGNPNIMRILPPLNINKKQIDQFVENLSIVVNKVQKSISIH